MINACTCTVSNSAHSSSRLPLISIWKPVYSLITGSHCFPLHIIIVLCVVYHIYCMYIVHMYTYVHCIHIQHITCIFSYYAKCISINIYICIYFIQENEVHYINSNSPKTAFLGIGISIDLCINRQTLYTVIIRENMCH